MNFTSKNLKSGAELNFQTKNAFDCVDVDLATVHFSETLNKFVVWFNGKLVGSYKQIQGAKTKIGKLISEHRLEFLDETTY